MAGMINAEIDLIAKSLDFRARRHDLIVSNVANADTPGYKAVDLSFEKTLERSVEKQNDLVGRTTHPDHLPIGDREPGDEAELITKRESTRLDGNSVDLDGEIVNLNINQLQFNAGVETLNKTFALLSYAVEEGGK